MISLECTLIGLRIGSFFFFAMHSTARRQARMVGSTVRLAVQGHMILIEAYAKQTHFLGSFAHANCNV